MVESPPGAEWQRAELNTVFMVKDVRSSSSAMKLEGALSAIQVVGGAQQVSCYHIQGPLTAVSAFQSNWRRGVGFPLGPLNHGRLLNDSAGLYELYGAFGVPRSMPAHLPTHTC